ncbi:putative uncharacterized protein [Parachlamydia acanthamoebae UV-7]|uniref:Uncharacterized protein n=2 Tax=Parachlamydia acanthamoebae TaxID=83552 RepID=F8KWZ3_PARAV|nr:hypothetical protein pah_c004o236 [Parachlamydia acanthamoebae str. Hall's coccus]KIA77426.1 hypothetical protein DB43_GG00050 [Parachlamydia acanthamoebae]CCB86840.1 putative uncharacterized protein [Parachlamydia acanthamoebae UV-7]
MPHGKYVSLKTKYEGLFKTALISRIAIISPTMGFLCHNLLLSLLFIWIYNSLRFFIKASNKNM